MPVTLHRLAAADFVRARRYYARYHPSTEPRFVAAVRAALLRIEGNPNLGSPHGTRFRWARVARYQYLIYYEVLGPRAVYVYAVAHTGRRPGYWLRRVNRP